MYVPDNPYLFAQENRDKNDSIIFTKHPFFKSTKMNVIRKAN
jgi:hypothetical protein